MSSYDDDGDDLERGGDCATCGDPVAEDWHQYCGPCYRIEMGWDDPPSRPTRPAQSRSARPAGAPPPEAPLPLAVVAALAVLHAEIAELRDWIDSVERVLDRESRRAA